MSAEWLRNFICRRCLARRIVTDRRRKTCITFGTGLALVGFADETVDKSARRRPGGDAIGVNTQTQWEN